jgi:hypothetical protein
MKLVMSIIFQNFEPTPIITVLVKVDDDLKFAHSQFLLIGIDNYLGRIIEILKVNRYSGYTRY